MSTAPTEQPAVSIRPAVLAFPQAPHGIEVAQIEWASTAQGNANMVTRFAILEDLSLRPAPAKLPGKPVGELIEGLLLIRRGVRVHEPGEPWIIEAQGRKENAQAGNSSAHRCLRVLLAAAWSAEVASFS
jgi:hypothetical protein